MYQPQKVEVTSEITFMLSPNATFLRKMCQPGFLLDDGIGGAHRGEDEQECAQYKLGVVQTFCLKTCGTDDNDRL